MLGGMFLFSAVDTQAKFLTSTFHPAQIIWFRQLGLLIGVLILLYLKGFGTQTPDEAIARAWLKLAATQGLDTAQLDYGTWLVDGIGGPRDYETGFSWMRRAAQGGNVAAQLRLARLYRNGIGVEGDPTLAAAWYIKARRAGLKDARLDVFLDGLDDESRDAALKQANKL